MAKMQVFTLENLQQYDGLIKNYIGNADAKSLKTVALVGNTLKFYKVEEPVGDTTPAYEITLPETDVSGLLEKLTGATEDNVVTVGADGTVKDSGIKSADLALKSEVEAVSEIANEAKEALEELNNADTGFIAQAEDYTDTKIQELTEGAIKDNADAIAAINDADTGILKTAQTYADEKVTELADGQVKTNKEAIEKLNGNAETEGSVAKAVKDASDAINAVIGDVEEGKTVVGMIEEVIANGYDDEEVRELIQGNTDAIDALDEKVGDVATLKTTEKTSVVGAINEVSDAVATAVDGAKVTISTDATTEGYLKTYTIKQGETEVGKIDIAKDLVVTAGEVVVNPDGQSEGTYIKLTIANQEAPVYVNVKDLCDVYTAQASAAQIQLSISDTNEISATIVAGSVGTDELADGAVTTAKIADKNVTLAKLEDSVQATLAQVETNKDDIEALQTLMGEGVEAIPESAITALFS